MTKMVPDSGAYFFILEINPRRPHLLISYELASSWIWGLPKLARASIDHVNFDTYRTLFGG